MVFELQAVNAVRDTGNAKRQFTKTRKPNQTYKSFFNNAFDNFRPRSKTQYSYSRT